VTHVDTDALVLRHVKQGDTSHVVTLLTRDGGKIAVMAKGSRKPGSKIGPGLGLFHRARIRYRERPNRDLVFLDSCELATSYDTLPRDVVGYAVAGVCAELVDRLVPDGGASPEIFDLLREAFESLAEVAPLPAGEELRAVGLSVVFELKLMDVLGVAPELTGCVACGDTQLESSTTLSPRRGGLLCPRCRAAEGGRRLGTGAVAFLRSGLFGELSDPLTAATPPTRGALLDARGALDALLEYHHHGKPAGLKSRRFLDGLWKK
jgi:DNA repair protein RecO (recombination protein O)